MDSEKVIKSIAHSFQKPFWYWHVQCHLVHGSYVAAVVCVLMSQSHTSRPRIRAGSAGKIRS